MVKSQYFSRVRNTIENDEFCTARDEIYLVLILVFSFNFIPKGEFKKEILKLFRGCFSSDLTFSLFYCVYHLNCAL